MCGIAGTFGLGLPNQTVVQNTLKRMRHRGPNAVGAYRDTEHDNQVCLLHTRLSIIDPDQRANQPFKRGDLVLGEPGMRHKPQAVGDEACVCLVAQKPGGFWRNFI